MGLDRILADEPTSSLLDEVLWERAKVAERLADPETAAAMYRQLVDAYPDSDHREAARRALARLVDSGDGPP